MKISFSAGGIVVHGSDVLLVCENGTFWGFPKGRIESGETPQKTAIREIAEETGCMNTAVIKELGSYSRHPFTLSNQLDTSEVKHITIFLLRADTKVLAQPSEENAIGQWFAKEHVLAQLTHPEDRAFYERVWAELP
jgi:8-oxo-dGTP pyrophosphatase MutT (NUDIX family)